jgi:hypothetical protein
MVSPGTTPYQVRQFEPAFMTSRPMVAAYPYSPSTIAVVAPVLTGPGADAVVAAPSASVTPAASVDPAMAVGAAATVGPSPWAAGGFYPGAAAAVGGCGTCCGKAYSPLPPNAVQAWASVMGCGGMCGLNVGGCGAGCQRRLY